ncbi:MAG: SulP family inorganic anion transporter [Chloroflexota bacterium]
MHPPGNGTRFAAHARSLIPALSWLSSYRRQNLGGDLTAGLIVAVMLIPQAMAYALLAGLPPVVGLYAATIPLILYALFGSSRHLAVGPVAIVSLFTLAAVERLAEPGSDEFVALALLLALLAGAIQLLLGIVRAGFLVKFLSHAVVSGFTSAAAIIIGLSQLKHLLGFDLENSENIFALLASALRSAGDTHPETLLIGGTSIAALILLRRWNRRIPAPLVIVVIATLAVYFLNLDSHGVSVVGDVPAGLPGISVPEMDATAAGSLLVPALTISFVGFMESIAVAQSIAAREKYRVDANQELRALGIANIGAGFFGGYPVTGGFSRSAVNYQAGARTGLASIITAGLIIITLLLFTDLFYYLPNAVLAAIVIVAVAGLVDIKEPVRLFRIKRPDAATLALTFVATLTLGIEPGILIGVGFSLLVFIWRTAHPHTAEMGYLPDLGVFRNIKRYPEAQTFPEAVILRIDESLYFANSSFLVDRIREALFNRPDVRWVVLDFWSVNDMDAVAIETLESLMAQYRASGVRFIFAGVKGPLRDLMQRAGWDRRDIDADIHYLSVHHALQSIGLLENESIARDRVPDLTH